MKDATTGPRPQTLFTDESLWQAWLDVEAALARAQARIGAIPEQAAQDITGAARLDRIGTDRLRASIARTMAPVLSLTHCLAEAAGEESGRYVHWGATTQNVMQTGRLLLLRHSRDGMRTAMARALDRLGEFAEAHAETAMAGRTNRRHALPITFGFKVAGWIEELERAEQRLSDADRRTFRLPFGGAVGAYHSFGSDGPRLMTALAKELELGELLVPSRTVNDLFVDYVTQLGMFAMSLERVAQELYLLMTEEIGEIREVLEAGVVGSSTMPHKVNPKRVVRVKAQCSRLRAQVAPALESGLSSHEGDAATNHLLSSVMDEAVPLGWTLAEGFAELLDRVEPDPERMRENLARSGPLLATEQLMMALAPEVGRGRAHDLIHHALETAQEEGAEVIPTLLAMPEVAALGEERVRDLLDPASYTGESAGISRAAASRAAELSRSLRAGIR